MHCITAEIGEEPNRGAECVISEAVRLAAPFTRGYWNFDDKTPGHVAVSDLRASGPNP